MSLKTCPLCNQQYEDYFINWSSKYCCRTCFKNRNTKYKIGDLIYTYSNKKNKDKTISAILSEGVVINIYTINRPTKNGIYQFAIKLKETNKVCYRFVHQIFNNKKECLEFVDVTNKRRIIMRQANKLLKELNI